MIDNTARIALLSFIALLCAACSATVVELTETLDTSALDPTRYRLLETVTIEAPRAADLTLRADTEWFHIGNLSHGRVWDTDDQVIIVNSFNVAEAAVVAKDGLVVGYYLKVAKAFVAADPTSIEFTKVE